jgi:2'-hydroxyisoflavone reductase
VSRLLFIGGTRFVGRHAAAAALAAGHDVTLLHRGKTGAGLFPQAEHLLADRDADPAVLAPVLAGRDFDATVDSCGYVPRQVRTIAETLGERAGHYVYVSSVSAYASPPPAGVRDESMPLAPVSALEDPETEEITPETYGPLEVACEEAALGAFGPDRVTIVRPTYVVGPFDPTYRFTYWVERVAQGGRVLAPGPAENPFQAIDGRDLGSFLASCAVSRRSGAFHAVNPAPPFSFGELLELVAGVVAPSGTSFEWVEAPWLLEHGVEWAELPMWAGEEPDRELGALDPGRAFAAGLSPRPLEETVRDLHRAEAESATPAAGTVGLTPERERELLEAWTARS